MALRHPHADDLPQSDEISYEEGMAWLDGEARRRLGISGEEFLRRYDAGEYAGIEEDEVGRAVVKLIFVIPFARPTRRADDGRLVPVG